MTAPVRLPELGPYLGHLVDPPGRFEPAEIGLDDVRLALVTDLFERAQTARGCLLSGDSAGALSALGRSVWLDLWRGAVDRVTTQTVAVIEARLRRAAKASAMSNRRLARMLPNAEDRAVLHARLDAAAIPLEQLTERLATARAEAWVEIVRQAAGALQSAWEAVEHVVHQALAEWQPAIAAAENWRPAPLIRWVPGVLLAVLAGWLGLGIGGYLPLPAFLAPVSTWFWGLPWP
ncbi:MAG: hypothetical protein ABI647_09150 [Gemmatimonadota bacterium]